MRDYVSELEAQLEQAEARIAELESEIRKWKSGAKSVMAAMVEERLAKKAA